ncbi:hypothetical protein [Ruegeria sp. HKCCA4707]|uniref:hypothetical protein n=1 Tax=Ruegeria sp. HKCCA4707 TaxID=2682984 RepID=UPI001488CE43|nr:hypothetical protein [Ruegeria sp. HKCCA4707]
MIADTQSHVEGATDRVLRQMVRPAEHDGAVLFAATPDYSEARPKMVLQVTTGFMEYMELKNQLAMIADLRGLLDQVEQKCRDMA